MAIRGKTRINIFLLTAFTAATIVFVPVKAQKKFGYTVLHFRCSDADPQRDRIYYSPIIELNTLNFPQYTTGIDPNIPLYSARYYNYAIARWFEMTLRDKYNVLINAVDKYARKTRSVVLNEQKNGRCNGDLTDAGCFFLSKEELEQQRKKDIETSRLASSSASVCEVIEL